MEQSKWDRAPDERTLPLACRYLLRALRLRCPVCGISPMFVRFTRLRGLYDWFTPLDGCHRCGYPYLREPGYWLVPVWIIGFGVSTGSGAIVAGLVYHYANLDLIWISLIASLTTGTVALLFSRQAKALFLAIDRFCDPEEEQHL